jgi:hypothetical protein
MKTRIMSGIRKDCNPYFTIRRHLNVIRLTQYLNKRYL